MELVVDILCDAAKDSLLLAPFLFATYLVLALLEIFASSRLRAHIARSGVAGPFVGAIAGIVPQCGFSAMGATLYSERVISLGTLLAVFLSTSDEMLPLLIAEQVDASRVAFILLVKGFVAVSVGLSVDGVSKLWQRSDRTASQDAPRTVAADAQDVDRHAKGRAHKESERDDERAWAAVCELAALRQLGPSGYPAGEFLIQNYDETPSYTYACSCGCENVNTGNKRDVARAVLRSACRHTIKVTAFIFLITLVLVGILETVGEQPLAEFLSQNEFLAVCTSSFVALIPNCAASVVITQLYLEGALSFGPMIAGSLVGVGVGFLVLFGANKNAKENIAILAFLWMVGVVVGCGFTAFGV